MGPVNGRGVTGNCSMRALLMRDSKLVSDGAVRECWVMWMRSSSRRLFDDSRISLVAQRWSLVSARRLNGRFGVFVSAFFAGLKDWCCREDLLKRAKALQKKQRAGQGAPPTPTLRFSSVSSTPTVPDFTPVHFTRRQGVSSTLPRLAAPAFHAQTTPQLPASLMAPRYSHLLEEARSLSQQ